MSHRSSWHSAKEALEECPAQHGHRDRLAIQQPQPYSQTFAIRAEQTLVQHRSHQVPCCGQNSEFQSRNHYSAWGVFYLGVSGLYLIPPAQSNAAGRGHVTLASKQRQMLSFTSPTACCLYTAQDLHNSHQGCAKRLLLAHPANTMSCSLVCTRISSCSTAIQGKRYCRRYKRWQCSSFPI